MAVDKLGDWRGSPKLANAVQSCRRWDGFPDGLLLFVNIFLNDDLGAVLAQRCFRQMPCSELLLERGNRQDILVDQNQGRPEIPPMARRFRLALKVQSSNVRTDTDRAAGLMKTRGTYERQDKVLSSDLSTTAAGVTNARRKPDSVEP